MPRKTFGKNVLATLRFQPSNRGLVMDLQQAVFVRYVGFAFKWNSSLSTLNFTVDYSLDGIHWTDYVEDERLKVKQFYVRFLHKTSHYEVSRRIFIKQPRRRSKRGRRRCISCLGSVVRKMDSATHRINLYPVDNAIGFSNTCPLDIDLSGG